MIIKGIVLLILWLILAVLCLLATTTESAAIALYITFLIFGLILLFSSAKV